MIFGRQQFSRRTLRCRKSRVSAAQITTDSSLAARPLAKALPRAVFREFHQVETRNSPEEAYRQLEELQWQDLRVTAALMAVRGIRARRRRGLSLQTLRKERFLNAESIFKPLLVLPGEYIAVGFLATPWDFTAPLPAPQPLSLEELRDAEGNDAMKIGMDFSFTAQEGGSRISTLTLCHPTSTEAAKRFTAYWRLIRPFSGLIRREILTHLAS